MTRIHSLRFKPRSMARNVWTMRLDAPCLPPMHRRLPRVARQLIAVRVCPPLSFSFCSALIFSLPRSSAATAPRANRGCPRAPASHATASTRAPRPRPARACPGSATDTIVSTAVHQLASPGILRPVRPPKSAPHLPPGFTKPLGTGPVTAVTGLTGPARFRFRFRAVRNRPKFKF